MILTNPPPPPRFGPGEPTGPNDRALMLWRVQLVQWLIANVGTGVTAPAVASDATMVFPIQGFFTITGVIGVGAVSGLVKGQSGSFVTPDGAVTFTAGASIGNTLTTTQNIPVFWWFDGVKLWLR